MKELMKLPCRALLIGLGLLATATGALATEPEALRQQVAGFVEEFALSHYPRQRINVEVNNLDSRTSLRNCDEPLDMTIHGKQSLEQRMLIRVSCTDAGWSIYVPVKLQIFRKIAIARHVLSRGQTVTEADIDWLEQDIAPLNGSFFTRPRSVVGKRTRRNIPAGQIIKPQTLERALTVRKGDEVYITAQTGSISVRMLAVALDNGKTGDKIEVRNKRSNKVIQARVTGPGQVDVVM